MKSRKSRYIPFLLAYGLLIATSAAAADYYYPAYCRPVYCPPVVQPTGYCPAPRMVVDPVGSSYVTLFKTNAQDLGENVGTVVFTDRPQGMEITVDLSGLPPGEHGFHVHAKGDCSTKAADGTSGPGLGAGGHYDPANTGKHLGPGGGGHRGDLPRLIVDANGNAKTTMWVKGLTAWELKYRSLMVHAGGDNYADTPEPLGGGGARIACGIIM